MVGKPLNARPWVTTYKTGRSPPTSLERAPGDAGQVVKLPIGAMQANSRSGR